MSRGAGEQVGWWVGEQVGRWAGGLVSRGAGEQVGWWAGERNLLLFKGFVKYAN